MRIVVSVVTPSQWVRWSACHGCATRSKGKMRHRHENQEQRRHTSNRLTDKGTTTQTEGLKAGLGQTVGLERSRANSRGTGQEGEEQSREDGRGAGHTEEQNGDEQKETKEQERNEAVWRKTEMKSNGKAKYITKQNLTQTNPQANYKKLKKKYSSAVYLWESNSKGRVNSKSKQSGKTQSK